MDDRQYCTISNAVKIRIIAHVTTILRRVWEGGHGGHPSAVLCAAGEVYLPPNALNSLVYYGQTVFRLGRSYKNNTLRIGWRPFSPDGCVDDGVVCGRRIHLLDSKATLV